MENEFTSNDSVVDPADLGCPSYSYEAEQQVELFSFWVEGISQVIASRLYAEVNWKIDCSVVKQDPGTGRGPGRTVKQEQDKTSRNHAQTS